MTAWGDSLQEVQTIRTKECAILDTKGADGKINGQLIEIINTLEPFMQLNSDIEQVYITTCLPGRKKGLHAHTYKEDRFCVIKGRAQIALYSDGEFRRINLSEDILKVIIIPPKVYHGIKCLGKTPCWILSCPSEGYDKNNPDQDELIMDW